MKYFNLSLVFLLIILAACSTNISVQTPPQALSNPNHNSMYFYMAASMQFWEGGYANAWSLFQRALSFDQNSKRIKKDLIMSALYDYLLLLEDEDRVRKLVDENRDFIQKDKDLLDLAYSFYASVEDRESQSWVIDSMLKYFPSARAHMLDYLYSFSVLDKPDSSLLFPALDYIQNDIDQLSYLGQIFEPIEPQFALQTAKRIYELEANTANAQTLAYRLSDYAQENEQLSYFNALKYPEDQELMYYILDGAMDLGHLSFLNKVACKVIDTKDSDLGYIVAVAALLSNNSDAISCFEEGLSDQKQKIEPYVASLLIANSFLEQNDKDLASLLQSQKSSGDLDNIIRFYILSFSNALKDQEQSPSDSIYIDFAHQMAQRLPEGVMKDYLVTAVLGIASEANPQTEEAFSKAKETLIDSFMKQNIYDSDDIAWLLQRYYYTDRISQRIPLLRLALEQFPGQALWYNDLGYTLLSIGGNLDEAGELIYQAINLEPENYFFLDSIAWYHYHKKDYQQALDYMNPVMEMADMPAEIAYHIGLIYMRLNDFENARAYMKYATQFTEEEPDYAELAKRALEVWGVGRLTEGGR